VIKLNSNIMRKRQSTTNRLPSITRKPSSITIRGDDKTAAHRFSITHGQREEQEMEANKKYAVTHGLKVIGTMITTRFADKLVRCETGVE
jgi:hypothetical protein